MLLGVHSQASALRVAVSHRFSTSEVSGNCHMSNAFFVGVLLHPPPLSFSVFPVRSRSGTFQQLLQ